jgi:hypothetical protein
MRKFFGVGVRSLEVLKHVLREHAQNTTFASCELAGFQLVLSWRVA